MADARLTTLLRSKGIFHCDTLLPRTIGLHLPPLTGSVMYHLVLRGTCVVSRGIDSTTAEEGDIVLVPHGSGHRIAATHNPESWISLEDSGREDLGEGIERLDLSDGHAESHVVCGALTLEHPASPGVPRRLPTLVGTAGKREDLEGSRAVARLVLHEAERQLPGWAQISAHLVEALAMREIRRAITDAPFEAGWWSASNDDAIGPVLAAVLSNLRHEWSVAAMSGVARLSRSAFSERFSALTGEPPMAWVTRMRMAEAQRLLRQGIAVSAAAREVGYASEVSFRRAYRRIIGVPPGHTRTVGPNLLASSLHPGE